MNIVCRICRSWILRQRIESQRPRLERVAFAWGHDAVLARHLADAAGRTAARDVALFRDGSRLRVTLFRALLDGFRAYQRDYREVLSFAPGEKMSAARRPMVRRVRQALRQLDDLQRLIVALVDLGGCSYTEASQVLEIPRSELVVQLCHARVHLKMQLFDAVRAGTPTAQFPQWRTK